MGGIIDGGAEEGLGSPDPMPAAGNVTGAIPSMVRLGEGGGAEIGIDAAGVGVGEDATTGGGADTLGGIPTGAAGGKVGTATGAAMGGGADTLGGIPGNPVGGGTVDTRGAGGGATEGAVGGAG
jgi:hypothetical protein